MKTVRYAVVYILVRVEKKNTEYYHIVNMNINGSKKPEFIIIRVKLLPGKNIVDWIENTAPFCNPK